MNEVKNGLFSVEESMPCTPRKIRIGHYFMPSTLGRSEQEEAAARIISFSQKLDQWVGVSWPKIVEMMKADYEKDKASREKLDRHNERMEVWFRQLRRHFRLCVLTFGVYSLFVRKPERPTEKKERLDMPFSGIYIFGPQHVVTGIQELLERDMLRKVREGEGDNAIDVLFPTPTLISHIMQVQSVTA